MLSFSLDVLFSYLLQRSPPPLHWLAHWAMSPMIPGILERHCPRDSRLFETSIASVWPPCSHAVPLFPLLPIPPESTSAKWKHRNKKEKKLAVWFLTGQSKIFFMRSPPVGNTDKTFRKNHTRKSGIQGSPDLHVWFSFVCTLNWEWVTSLSILALKKTKTHSRSHLLKDQQNIFKMLKCPEQTKSQWKQQRHDGCTVENFATKRSLMWTNWFCEMERFCAILLLLIFIWQREGQHVDSFNWACLSGQKPSGTPGAVQDMYTAGCLQVKSVKFYTLSFAANSTSEMIK